MVEVLFKVLDVGLELWLSKEKTKYIDQMISLKKAFYEESNKPPADRSDAVLDNIEFQLRLLAIGFAASAGKQDATPKP